MSENQLRLIAIIAMVAIAVSAIIGAMSFAGYMQHFDTLRLQQQFHDRNNNENWAKRG